MRNKLKWGVAALLAIALITASVVSTNFNGAATADNLNPSPNVSFTGDAATVSWEAQLDAARYRIGWTTMPQVRTAIAEGIPWTERFAYTDVRAAVTSHRVSPLAPAIQHAFVVGTRSSTGTYTWSEWNILTTPSSSCDCTNGSSGNPPLPPPTPTAEPTQQPGVTPTARPNTPTKGEGGRSITVSPRALTSSSTITISGSSFTANGSVEIVHIANAATPSDLDRSWNSSASALYEYLRSFGNVIHTVSADSNGDFTTSFSIDTDEFEAGANYIAAKQAGLNGLSSAAHRFVFSE